MFAQVVPGSLISLERRRAMVAPLTQAYYAKTVARLGGRRLQGWTREWVRQLVEQQRVKVEADKATRSSRSPLRRGARPARSC